MSECRFEATGEPCDCGKGHQKTDLADYGDRKVLISGSRRRGLLAELAGAAAGQMVPGGGGKPGALAGALAALVAAGNPLPPFEPTVQRTWRPKTKDHGPNKQKARRKAKAAAASRAKNRGRR